MTDIQNRPALPKVYSCTLDLHHCRNKSKLDLVAQEHPAFWPMVLGILNEDNTNFMNPCLTNIVKKLVDKRYDINAFDPHFNP